MPKSKETAQARLSDYQAGLERLAAPWERVAQIRNHKIERQPDRVIELAPNYL